VAELLLEPLVLPVPDGPLAMGVTALGVSACPAVIGLLRIPATVAIFPPRLPL